jgi:hypothetical protein
MSLHIAQLFSRKSALISAAFVIHIGVATAADSMGDIQQRVQELLTGTTTAQPVQSGSHDGKVTAQTADAQEFAKQLLLGTTGSRLGGAEAIKHSEVLVASVKTEPQGRPALYRDIQPAVQQFLLGTHHQSDLTRGTINAPTADARRR